MIYVQRFMPLLYLSPTLFSGERAFGILEKLTEKEIAIIQLHIEESNSRYERSLLLPIGRPNLRHRIPMELRPIGWKITYVAFNLKKEPCIVGYTL